MSVFSVCTTAAHRRAARKLHQVTHCTQWHQSNSHTCIHEHLHLGQTTAVLISRRVLLPSVFASLAFFPDLLQARQKKNLCGYLDQVFTGWMCEPVDVWAGFLQPGCLNLWISGPGVYKPDVSTVASPKQQHQSTEVTGGKFIYGWLLFPTSRKASGPFTRQCQDVLAVSIKSHTMNKNCDWRTVLGHAPSSSLTESIIDGSQTRSSRLGSSIASCWSPATMCTSDHVSQQARSKDLPCNKQTLIYWSEMELGFDLPADTHIPVWHGTRV